MSLKLVKGHQPNKVISLNGVILRTIDRAEQEIKRYDCSKALNLLQQANRLYRNNGYDFEVESRLNQATYCYILVQK